MKIMPMTEKQADELMRKRVALFGKEFAKNPVMTRRQVDGLVANIAEEAGEVACMAAKWLRFGWASYHPDDKERTRNDVLLAREIGNLLAVAELLGLDTDEIEHGKTQKHRRLSIYGVSKREDEPA